MDLNNSLMQAHSVRHFVERLAGDLEQGRSTLALFPKGMDYSLLQQSVDEILWQKDCDTTAVWLPDLPVDETAPGALGSVLQARWKSSQTLRTVESLAACDNLPEVIHLRGFEQIAKDGRGEWLALVRRWAAAEKSLEAHGQRPTALCMMISADSLSGPPPSPGVWLGIRWWWAIPSALEMRLLCRRSNGIANRDLDLQDRWQEHIMPSLVGNNVELSQFLWSDLTRDTDHVLDRLSTWAEQRGWTLKALRKWGLERVADYAIHKGDGRVSEPPSQQRNLWVQGLLNWTPEYGTMLSPAALAIMEEYQSIEHRLWRGQVTLLLPLIDHLRLSLCRHWTTRYGPDWPWCWRLPQSPEEAEAVRDNPFASEWGHIETLLRSRAELREERVSLPLVSHARYARNRLAHYHPVTFRDYEILWYGGRIQ